MKRKEDKYIFVERLTNKRKGDNKKCTVKEKVNGDIFR